MIYENNQNRTPKSNEALSLISFEKNELEEMKKGLNSNCVIQSHRVIPLGFEPRTPTLKV